MRRLLLGVLIAWQLTVAAASVRAADPATDNAPTITALPELNTLALQPTPPSPPAGLAAPTTPAPTAPSSPSPSNSNLAQNRPQTSPNNRPTTSQQRQYRLASVPNMIGDPFLLGNFGPGFRGATSQYIPLPGETVGRANIAENTSPFPRDRIFFDYSYFDQVPLNAAGVGVNRIAPGFEKTFLDGLTSIDVRFPVANSLSNNIVFPVNNTFPGPAPGTTRTGDWSFGNILTTFKLLLYQGNIFALSGGLGLQLPTAAATTVSTSTNIPLARIDDGSVRYLPFVGWVLMPTNRLYFQGFSQFDIDSQGARVTSATPINGATSFRVHDNNLVYNDVGAGYWLIQNGSGAIRALAPTFEMHYATTINSPPGVTIPRTNNSFVGGTSTGAESLNLTFGVNVGLRSNTWLTTAYAIPVTGSGLNKQFNGEFRFLLNRYFGPNAPKLQYLGR